MKIQSSMVAMQSSREYKSFSFKKTAEITTREEEAGVIFELSSDSKDVVQSLEDYKKEKDMEAKKKQEEALANHMSRMLKDNKVENTFEVDKLKDEFQLQLECLRKIIASLNKKLGKNNKYFDKGDNKFTDVLNNKLKEPNLITTKPIEGVISGGTKWVKSTATSVFMTETENTSFNAMGMVKTADGRQIEFGVSVEMSRAFCAKYNSISQEEVIFTDPLVFNMEGNVANISNQKFLFDLNCDGTQEEISFAGDGSGFLALDKNKDGVINDGSELFGTKSGNGFKDLAEYDSDGNGWIDENDDIFDDLRIWTKDSEGNDRLVTLKESDVGAIYLGYADTEFTLNNMDTNGVNGIVRGTGVFLKESGGVGTVQHIDLAL